MFRTVFPSIIRSWKLRIRQQAYVKQLLLPAATGRQRHGCIIPQAVTLSLVLLKMGKMIARNMLSWLELLINRYCCVHLVVYIILSMMHGQANIRFAKTIFFFTCLDLQGSSSGIKYIIQSDILKQVAFDKGKCFCFCNKSSSFD